jgi:hypothetical protein
VHIESRTRDKEAGHDLTAKLAKALVLLDKPMMKRVLPDNETLLVLVLRVDEDVHAVSLTASGDARAPIRSFEQLKKAP